VGIVHEVYAELLPLTGTAQKELGAGCVKRIGWDTHVAGFERIDATEAHDVCRIHDHEALDTAPEQPFGVSPNEHGLW
jgi:hypothetical protein